MSIAEGAIAPEFTLPDQHGEPVSLSQYRGKPVIVYFYPKDDTPGCTKQACGFRDAWRELQALGVVLLGVSPDAPGKHRAFIDKYRLPSTLLSDPDKTLLNAWGAFGEKMMYGKRTQGVIRSTVWIDADGVMKKHWKKVTKAAEHPQHVLDALRAAMS